MGDVTNADGADDETLVGFGEHSFGEGSAFAEELVCAARGCGGATLEQDFDRDSPIKLGVVGREHAAHAPAA